VSTVFPKWTNRLPTMMLAGVLGGLVTAIGVAWYAFTPKYWRIGYMPAQPAMTPAMIDGLSAAAKAGSKTNFPVPGHTYPGFSHQIHAGRLGMDCRYCHSHVESSTEANIPSVSTCMGCHAPDHVDDQMYAKAENVQFIRDAWQVNASIPWRRVHKLPDYVRNFPHNVHLAAGVSCFSCHGNIMEQQVVHQVQPLSMGWCLDCHRNPTPHLVPKEKVTDLFWVRNQIAGPEGNVATTGGTASLDAGSPGGAKLLEALEKKQYHLLPNNCGACHY